MKRTIGIDLGTTNTVGAVGGMTLSGGSEDSSIIPSVVAFPPNGATLVGAMAKRRRAIDPKNTVSSAKRLMGKAFRSYNATQFRKQYAVDLIETEGNGCAFKTRAGSFSPGEIASYVIGKLLASHQIDPISYDAVIAVPVSFDDTACSATLTAARQAGLREVSTVSEPIATAMAHLSRGKSPERLVAVYDLGGGTFDLAIVDAHAHPAKVVCHGGDPYLGGDDIDKTIADWAAQQVLERHNWDVRSQAESYDRLMVQCERAKIRLCFAPQTRIELSQVDPGSPAASDSIALTRDTLRQLADPFIARTFLICDQVLREAGLSTAGIDAVFLAGGTTLLPSVRDGVARYFGVQAHAEFDPMEVVSAGASLMSPS